LLLLDGLFHLSNFLQFRMKANKLPLINDEKEVLMDVVKSGLMEANKAATTSWVYESINICLHGSEDIFRAGHPLLLHWLKCCLVSVHIHATRAHKHSCTHAYTHSQVAADADAVVVLLRNTFSGAARSEDSGDDGATRGEHTQAPTTGAGGAKQGKGSGRGGKGSKAAAASEQSAGSSRQQAQNLPLAKTWLEMEGGAPAVDAAFAHLARLTGDLSQQLPAQQKQTQHSAHVVHTSLLGHLQDAGAAVDKGDMTALPAAATPSQRLALLPHAIELLQVSDQELAWVM
jgi:hypothetical protein